MKGVLMPSFRTSLRSERDPESRVFYWYWIPAFAGMTAFFRVRALLLVLSLACILPPALAHPLAPSLLELRQIPAENETRFDVLWRTSVTRVQGSDVEPRLPHDCQPASEGSLLPEGNQSLVKRWQVRCTADGLAGRSIGVTGLDKSPINVILRIQPLDAEPLSSLLSAAHPVYKVPEPGSLPPVFGTYLKLGVEHLLQGLDHMLFIIGLLLLVRKLKRLIWTITAFTLGHSITLALAVLGFVEVNSAVTELAIALSILVLAHELVRPRPQSLFRRRPWMIAASFGLLHGLGFAGALAEVGLPSGEIPLALFAFNVGIELGQLLVIALALVLLRLWALVVTQRLPISAASVQALILPYLIGSLAAFWCIERAVSFMS